MFGYDRWLVLPAVVLVAALLAFAAGARRPALYAVSFLGAALVGAGILFMEPGI